MLPLLYLISLFICSTLALPAAFDSLAASGSYDQASALAAVEMVQAITSGMPAELGAAQSLCDQYQLRGRVEDFVAFYSSTKYNVLAFRGTQDMEDVFTDLNLAQIQCTAIDQGCGLVHAGFMDLYNRYSSQIKGLVDASDKKPLVIVGYSLGGALATLAALELSVERPATPIHALITLASPRVGDGKFVSDVYTHVHARVFARVFQVGMGQTDIITELPQGNFVHAGRGLAVDCSRMDATCTSVGMHFIASYETSLKAMLGGQCGYF